VSAFSVIKVSNLASGTSMSSSRNEKPDAVLVVGFDTRGDGTGSLPDAFVVLTETKDENFSIARDWTYSKLEPNRSLVEKYLDVEKCVLFCGLQGIYVHSLLEEPNLNPEAALDMVRSVVEEEYGLSNLGIIAIGMNFARSFLKCIAPIELNVETLIPIGGTPMNGKLTDIDEYVQPGTQQLSGRQLFWYGRARWGSSNEERMARQLRIVKSVQSQKNPFQILSCLVVSKGEVKHDFGLRDIPFLWAIAT
jgi:anionic cell wall polymer biosynthesis LytR-Cps2A-Psr (LCP) family protein